MNKKRTIAQVARDFGIGKNTIYKWKQALILTKYHFPPSMSGKGNCYDNAWAESFFKTLKVELVYHERYQTRQEANSRLFEYIEHFYNRIRLHSTLGYLKSRTV